ncbi:hypothetical protein D3C85_1375550 [compost metagenome]
MDPGIAPLRRVHVWHGTVFQQRRATDRHDDYGAFTLPFANKPKHPMGLAADDVERLVSAVSKQLGVLGTQV